MKVHNLELEAVLRRSTPTKLSKTPSTERNEKASSVDRTCESASLAQAPSLVAAGSRAGRCITGSADLTGATPTFSEISQPSPAMLSELLKFFSLLDELDRSAFVELERAA